MSSSVRVHELFPGPGGLSNKAADYSGTIVAVAAMSSRQAHVLVHKDAWAKDPEHPLGILWKYRSDHQPTYRLFTGETAYGSQLRHGARKRAIVAWMRSVLDGVANLRAAGTPC